MLESLVGFAKNVGAKWMGAFKFSTIVTVPAAVARINNAAQAPDTSITKVAGAVMKSSIDVGTHGLVTVFDGIKFVRQQMSKNSAQPTPTAAPEAAAAANEEQKKTDQLSTEQSRKVESKNPDHIENPSGK